MKKTITERVALHRERKKLGLVNLSVWIKPEWRRLIADFVKTLEEYKG